MPGQVTQRDAEYQTAAQCTWPSVEVPRPEHRMLQEALPPYPELWGFVPHFAWLHTPDDLPGSCTDTQTSQQHLIHRQPQGWRLHCWKYLETGHGLPCAVVGDTETPMRREGAGWGAAVWLTSIIRLRPTYFSQPWDGGTDLGCVCRCDFLCKEIQSLLWQTFSEKMHDFCTFKGTKE